jgi:hypothetical protein
MSVARGQRHLGETHGDVHTNVIGGHGHSGSAPSGAVPADSSLFNTSATFSVTGLNPSTSTPITQATNVGFASYPQNAGSIPATKPNGIPTTTSKVVVTSTSLGTGNSEVLDLFFQRTPVGPNAPPLNVGNKLTVGKPGPITLNLTGDKKVKVQFFLYFSTGPSFSAPNFLTQTKTQETSLDPSKPNEKVIRFGGTTPEMEVGKNPLNQTKVFYSLKDLKGETRSANEGKLVFPDFSAGNKFFELGDYTRNLVTLGLKGQAANLNGIHFDAVVTPVRG